MYKTLFAFSVVLLATSVQARFGVSEAFGLQGKLTACGLDSASAGNLGGAGIGILLAAPDPCARYEHADKIVEAAKAQNKPACIDVAREYTNAEKNFNPFAKAGPAAGPRFCDNANLPVSVELKGILPLVDPAVGGADAANQKATETLNQAKGGANLDNGGKSVQQQMLDIGFNNFFVGDVFPQPGGGAAPAPATGGAPAPAPATGGAPTPAPATGGQVPPPAANNVQGAPASACFTTQFVTKGAQTPCFTTQFVTATPGAGAAPTPAPVLNAPAANVPAPAANAPAPAANAPAPAAVETVFVTQTFVPDQCQATPAAGASTNSAATGGAATGGAATGGAATGGAATGGAATGGGSTNSAATGGASSGTASSDGASSGAAASNTGAAGGSSGTTGGAASSNAGGSSDATGNSANNAGNQGTQCFTTQFVTATPTAAAASACFTTQFVTATPPAGQAGSQATPCFSSIFFTPTPAAV